ncbi:MAG: hypothetical protein F4051_02780 [Boseongicola sp. SB0670_bin_30]|nr:hypothetical protein [Boseongicola sp. SB0670_bin_30]
MTNEHGFPGSWSPGKFRSLLAILLVLAGSLKGVAQTEFSEHEYNMYRSFYYDSLNVAIELAGRTEVHMSPEDFGKLPEDSRREICAVVVNYRTFRLVTTEAFLKKGTFGKEGTNSLHIRLAFDLAGVEWVSRDNLNETSPEDQQKTLQASADLTLFLKDSSRALGSKYEICLPWFLAECFEADPEFNPPTQLTPTYASVPLEFRLREFFQSQLPAVNWLLDNTRKSEERDNLQEFTQSMMRKYLLDP